MCIPPADADAGDRRLAARAGAAGALEDVAAVLRLALTAKEVALGAAQRQPLLQHLVDGRTQLADLVLAQRRRRAPRVDARQPHALVGVAVAQPGHHALVEQHALEHATTRTQAVEQHPLVKARLQRIGAERVEVQPLRQNLRRAITQRFVPGGKARVITLDPLLEQLIADSVRQTDQGSFVALEPVQTQKILENTRQAVERSVSLGNTPIILTSPAVRRHFKQITRALDEDLLVLSYNELDAGVEVLSEGVVSI